MISLQMLMDDPTWIVKIRNWDVDTVMDIPQLLGLSDDMILDEEIIRHTDNIHVDSSDEDMWKGSDFQIDPEHLAQIQWSADGDFTLHITDSVQESVLSDMCGFSSTVAWDSDLVLEQQHALVEVSVSLLVKVVL